MNEYNIISYMYLYISSLGGFDPEGIFPVILGHEGAGIVVCISFSLSL